jgi:hypothetical protein
MPENEKHEFSIYCNGIEVGFTPWDIRLVIKEIVDVLDQKPVIVKHGTIAMSPPHAKAMLEAMQRAIAIYEEKFGEIDLTKIKEAGAIAQPALLP